MAGNTDPIRKRASTEATDWLILLKDDPEDAARRREFEAWLRKSPVNAAAWEAMQRASNAMGKATPVHADRWKPLLAELRGETDGDKASDKRSTVNRTGRSTVNGQPAAGRIGRRKAIRFGGIAAAACLLALVVGPDLLLNLRADYATDTAETRTIRLPDDSTVTLAPESAIAVAYAPGERRIRLLAGEAFFEVAPQAERPFKVSTQTVDVTVLGTGFGVHRGDEGADVAVEHGSVRVDHVTAVPPVAETLTAGQSVRVSWAGRAERSDGPVDRIAAWRRDQLIARDEPLGAVVDGLRRYYAGKIIVADGVLAAQPVTGVYNLADPVEALRGIARAQNAVVRRITPWVVIVSAS
ncbi:MAG: FecR domain-containing protein [Hyphomicrobiales bacterium]|nr:FecR domain-containing protein [Hyphomicrobiales bacterium]